MALTQKSLLEYLNEKMGVDTSSIDDTTALFSSGLLDSFSMVDLIMFIEQEANMKLNPTDVNLDNLDTIQSILSFSSASN